MATSLHKLLTLNFISVVLLVLYSGGSPAMTCTATSVPPDLMTGLNLGKLSSVRILMTTTVYSYMQYIIIMAHSLQKIAITGTLLNPPKFELRFETLGSLLSLFDLQEKVTDQLRLMTEGNETQLNDDYLGLLTTQALLENIIQTSCNYVS